MQLNGTTAPTMAASEPPEPPPRNPEKINASLGKQITADAVSVHTIRLCNGIFKRFSFFGLYFPKCN